MTPFEEQFDALQKELSGASYLKIPDGSFVVTVPGLRLPDGWTAPVTTVYFIAPVGYPVSRPDCFWSDADLKLTGGRVPQNTGANPLPNGPAPLLWFSWHVSNWSPNADTLLTYVNVIKKRFQELK
ncbi:MAG: E2/UBC family protein [Pseudolabrys sp.]|nr:E2/UBC family protein [Pseudolabrys sp.]